MKLAIVGSRSLSVDVSQFVDYIPDCIITGGAIGVDRSACVYAKKNKIKLIVIKPEYNKFGKLAPIIRNSKIVDRCDSVLAIWDGHSNGTINIVETAKRMNKPLRLFIYERTNFKIACNNEIQMSLF